MNRSIKLLIVTFGMMTSWIVASDLGSYRLTQTIGEAQYESVFTQEAVAKNPVWAESQPLPLSFDQVIGVARQCIAKHQLGGPWSLSNIQLLKSAQSDVWLFEVVFDRPSVGVAGKEQLIVPVSLGGDAAAPVMQAKRKNPFVPSGATTR